MTKLAMEYWQKQTKDQPLFPTLLWSRPEHKAQAGKLAIIGGNAHGFAAVAVAYQTAQQAGIGTARVLLPEAIKKVVGPVLAEGEFAPSNPSGSFSQKALSELLELAAWADGVLIAGDLGRNSETAILLESFASKYSGALTLTQDAVDYFTVKPEPLLRRKNTTIVLSLSQLQKLVAATGFITPVTYGMDLLKLIELLHEFTTKHQPEIIVKHLENIFVAVNGEVTTTKLTQELPIWRVKTAATASVWRLQNPTTPLEALTSSLL